MDKLIVIAGPTAVGKTSCSVELAKKINGEIISADSMQVYKKMNIGTATVTEEEKDGIKHYMVNEIMPDEEFNIYEFKKKVEEYIKKIQEKGKTPILVGGTGFYIRAIVYDTDFKNEDPDFEYREKLEKEAEKKGNEFIHEKLKDIDKESYNSIHPNNVKRVVRALEFFKTNNQKISEHNRIQKNKKPAYDTSFFVLNTKDREILYDRINKRVEIMLDEGLLDEVKSLLDDGYTRDLVSMQGIGYKEIIPYIKGEISLDNALETLKQNTRNFAKRQLTWFRKEELANWIEVDSLDFDKDKIVNRMIEIINK